MNETRTIIRDYLAVDLETTGLSPQKDRIIEIGAVKYRDGEVIDTFSTLVKTYQMLPERITDLTGITAQMLEKEGVEEEEAILEFLKFAEGCTVILGHNVGFDFGFLKVTAERYGRDFERPALDTLRFAKVLYPELASRTLSAMCEYFGIVQHNAHRAVEDAVSAHLVYQGMLAEFPEYDGFTAVPMTVRVKKQEPMTPRQKNYLQTLLAHHGMEYSAQMDRMTKSDASRLIDKLILTKGRM